MNDIIINKIKFVFNDKGIFEKDGNIVTALEVAVATSSETHQANAQRVNYIFEDYYFYI